MADLTIPSLEPASLFLYQVRAFNALGPSKFSHEQLMQTEVCEPSVTRAIHCKRTTPQTLQLAWEPPQAHGKPIMYYQVRYRRIHAPHGHDHDHAQQVSSESEWQKVQLQIPRPRCLID